MEKDFKNIEKHKINEEKIQIFSKIENIEKEKEITNFEKLNLKVGKIFKIERVENSEKLYVLQIDFKDEKRQIVSGLQKIYKIEELQNRKIVAILNMKKAKLAGVESQGMVLAVDNPSDEE